jgi:scavenger receptor class B, member 1
MMGLGRGPLFVKRRVSELLFDGYEDRLLTVLRANQNPAFPKPPFEKMGWFVDRNNSETYDGKFRMFTGIDDIFKLGNLQLWNGKPMTNMYREHCGDVRGTTGELWPPIDEGKKPDLSLFVSDVCRTITLKYSEEYSKLGIDGYKWVADESVFDNGKKYPDMSCYCSAAQENCPDLASGVFNASKCKWDSPAFISFPHFYLADEIYRNNISGMMPDKDEHEFYMALEPRTGIPLSIKAALQINLLIRPYLGISEFREVPTMFVPMLWFKQRADLTPELAKQARMAVNLPSFGVWVSYGLLGAGLLIALMTIVCFVFRFRRFDVQDDGQNQPIIDSDENNTESN